MKEYKTVKPVNESIYNYIGQSLGNGNHSDDLGKKDYKENLWTEKWTRRMENKKQPRDTEYV
jgi:hypothetical protein